MFIKPRELWDALVKAGFIVGPQTGLGPRGLNRRGDITFGKLLIKAVLYMGIARLPEFSK